ncbi:hypothetical protein [Roseateles sp.]|uniref:hypothetical protein n=1 Tax=Roseateles sp. TaxID=1971397 RepID=UPI003BAA1FF0
MNWRRLGICAAIALMTLLALALAVRNELGDRLDLPLQWDELFFLTCTAREQVEGGMPWAGCHDNKGPLIYVLYALLLNPEQLYDMARLKYAAFGFSAAILAAGSALAWRAGGRWAAFIFLSLLGLHWASSPVLMALKTEQLGMLLMLLGLVVLPTLIGASGRDRPLLAGVLFGLSLLAKQVFVIPLVVLVIGLWATAAAQRVKLSVWMLAGVCLPFVFSLAYFWQAGRLEDHLASLVLHVTMYASPDPATFIQRWSWRFGGLAVALTSYPVFGSLLALLAAGLALRWRWMCSLAPAGLLFLVLGLLLIGLLTPMLMAQHLAPFFVESAVLAGVVAGRYLTEHGTTPAADALGMGWAICGLAVVLTVWFGPAGRAETGRAFYRFEKLPAAQTRYAYVAGIWPELFVTNGLLPASDVMYPTALPGAPNSWFFTRPDPATLKGRIAIKNFERNAISLMADFKRTPPSYIYVSNDMARSPGQARPTDIPVLADYIDSHCSYLREIVGVKQHAGVIYRCHP